MIWQDLVKTALIGSDKSTPSVSTVESLQKMGVTTVDPAKMVLEGAGVLSFLRKAAMPLQIFIAPMSDMSEVETAQFISTISAGHLNDILFPKKNKYLDAVIFEFLFWIQKNNKIIPYEFLPALFRFSRGNKELSAYLKSVVGKRGEWLANQNPEWVVYLQDSNKHGTVFVPYSKEETLTRLKNFIDIINSQPYFFSDNKKLNAEMVELATKADNSMLEHVDKYLSDTLPLIYQNKMNDIIHVIRFRKEMIKELGN